jgi:hypothetical protein
MCYVICRDPSLETLNHQKARVRTIIYSVPFIPFILVVDDKRGELDEYGINGTL